MANDEHVALLKKGVDAWNKWRDKNRYIRPDLIQADLSGANLNGANLSGANLSGADLSRANLYKADFRGADISPANLSEASLREATLIWANLRGANLYKADFRGADLSLASLREANLRQADLSEAKLFLTDLGAANLYEANLREADLNTANLREADLNWAYLTHANLSQANLSRANLSWTNLGGANLAGANLSEALLTPANLSHANLIQADLTGADLTGCRVYGVSAWGLKLDGTKQQDLVITRLEEPEIRVDNIEVAQFVYLLLHNEKIRDIIDTIGKKGVLLLGRFTEGRIKILERLREKLRDLGFVPMVFNFDKPTTKDFTETVRLLASLSKFVIVDITNPRSAPLELQATVPDYMVPFAPILQQGEEPFAMFVDLQNKYDWVLQPVVGYPSADRLIEVLEDKVVRRAEAKFNELLARRTNQLRVENA
jgi:uncharacterized protein YjbI with pentapeptide repeats